MMREGHGPGTIAMAVAGLAAEADVAAGSDFFAEAAQVSAQFVVADQADLSVFQCGAEAEGQVLLDCRREMHGLDFPAELLPGAFGELHSDSSAVDAGTLDLWKGQQAVELEFDFGEGLILKFDPKAVPHNVADLLDDVDHAEVVYPGNVHAEEELMVESPHLLGEG